MDNEEMTDVMLENTKQSLLELENLIKKFDSSIATYKERYGSLHCCLRETKETDALRNSSLAGLVASEDSVDQATRRAKSQLEGLVTSFWNQQLNSSIEILENYSAAYKKAFSTIDAAIKYPKEMAEMKDRIEQAEKMRDGFAARIEQWNVG